MKSYLRIQPGGFNIRIARIGGPGLANLLWLWSKMVVAHELTGLPMVWPEWRQIKPRSLLRGEFSMGYYPRFFSKSESYISQPLCYSRGRFVMADEEIMAGCLQELIQPKVVYGFSYLRDPFEGLYESKQVVRDAFLEICPPCYLRTKKTSEFTIVAHVRRGDFRQLGLGAQIQDYIYAIKRLVEVFKSRVPRVLVCTDALPSDQAFWSIMPKEVEVARGSNALEDLCLMMSADVLIGTARSSYSRAAAYLGDMPVLWCGELDVVSKLDGIAPVSASIHEESIYGDLNELLSYFQ